MRRWQVVKQQLHHLGISVCQAEAAQRTGLREASAAAVRMS
ncbi:MAG TPA: hypothetical protein VGQ93_12560 [Lysobacter sp.]|jgi:hypothetical protein|nr:hypothetical protein [Lysobacter sp.]